MTPRQISGLDPLTPSRSCFNRQPYTPTYPVQTGWTEDGRRITRQQDTFGEPDCQYTHDKLGRIDADCVGCKWRAAA